MTSTSTIRFREYDDSSSSLLCKSNIINNSKNDGTNNTNARFRECIVALPSSLLFTTAGTSSNLLNWKIVCDNNDESDRTRNSNNVGKQIHEHIHEHKHIHEHIHEHEQHEQHEHYFFLICHLQKIKDRWTHQLTQIVKDLFLPVGYVQTCNV